jgi:TRAP-type C4-dicarboxylate transport system substrate-binding protein
MKGELFLLRRYPMKRFLSLSCLLSAFFVLLGFFISQGYAQERTVTLKFSNFLFAQAQNSILAEQWCKEVEKRTNGRVKINIFHGGSLTPPPQVYDGVVKGISDLGMSVGAYTKGKFHLTGLIELPLGYKTGYIATKLANKYYKKFKPKEFDDVQVMYLSAHAPGVLISKKPVHKLEDLKGMKIRATAASEKLVATLGGIPVLMVMGETYDALSKGTVEGVLSPIEGLEQWKFAEVAKYTTEGFDSYTSVFFVVMNKNIWNSLTPAEQKTIEKINKEWIEKQGKQWDEIDKVGRDYGVKKGVEIITLPNEERERWTKAVRPLIDDYVKDLKEKGLPGEEGLKFCLDYLKAHQK